MSVKRQQKFYSQQRLTTSTMRGIESAVSADFDLLLRNFVTGTSTGYILNGLKVNINSTSFAADASTLTLNSLDSSVLASMAAESGTFLNIPGSSSELLNGTNSRVSGNFVAGITNYVSLDLIRTTDTDSVETTYFYDADSDVEISKLLPSATLLDYKIVISAVGFGSNLPIATVVTNASNIPTAITDCRQLLYRLGTGGVSPNPNYSYPWAGGRVEIASTSTSSATDPFGGGDKQLLTLKNWMDAVTTSIKEIKGSAYWFSTGSGGSSTDLSLFSLAEDTTFSYCGGSGAYTHSLADAGKLSWSSDIFIHSVLSNQYYKIATNAGVIIGNGQVLALSLTRYVSVAGTVTIAPSLGSVPSSVTTAAANAATRIIQGSVGQFTGMTDNSSITDAGDFTKVIADSPRYYAQISQFYGASGSVTASATATYAVLTASYGGVTGAQTIQYDKTYYANGALILVDSDDVLASSTLGSLRWIAARRDYGASVLVYLRDFGELQQGETRAISDNTTNNILQYVGSLTAGSPNESLSSPTYSATISGGIINSQTNYGGAAGDNLTDRVSKLTTGAANQAQNKNISLIGGGVVSNSTRLMKWTATAYVIINGPGSGLYNTIAADIVGVTLPVGGCAYVTVDRNTTAAPLTVNVATYANLPLSENVYVIARTDPSGNDIWVGLDGQAYLISSGSNSTTGFTPATAGSIGIANLHKWKQVVGTGDGSIVAFSTGDTPYSSGAYLVYRNGLLQTQGIGNEYTQSGDTATFSVAPGVSDELVFVYAMGNTVPYSYVQEVPTGTPNGILTSFGLTSANSNTKGVAVFLNGLQKAGDGVDFTITGNNIIFSFAPSIGSVVYAFYTTSNDNVYANQMQLLVGTGAKTFFQNYLEFIHHNALMISVDGVGQFPIKNTYASTSLAINDVQVQDPNLLVFSATGWAGAPPPLLSVIYIYGR